MNLRLHPLASASLLHHTGRDHDLRKRNAFVRPAVPASTPDRYVRCGLASRYGDAFDGKPTASGEPFDSNGGLTRLNRLIYQNL